MIRYPSQGHHQPHPLRSVPMFRSVSALGQAFAADRAPAGHARVLAGQRLEQAQHEIAAAWEFYGDARTAVSEVNRMARTDRHDRAIYSDRQVAGRRKAAFATMNRMRGRFLRAHRALAAAEAALAALGH